MTREYRNYDFTRPDRLSNEQKRVLRVQFEPVCRLLSIHYNTTLRTVVEMWLTDVDELRYRDIFRDPDAATGGKSLLAVWTPGPDQPQGLVQASLGLMFAFLERMMGGTGVTPIADKDLSEFEKRLFAQIIMRILSYYCKTFAGEEFGPTVERIETESALVPRSYAPEESMVRQIFRISLNGYIGHIVVTLPYEFFRVRMPQMRFAGGAHEDKVDPHRLEELGVVDVPMQVELGRAQLTLSQLMDLASGDVLELSGPVTVLVGEVPKFTAKPGLVGDRIAVEIMSQIVFENDGVVVPLDV